MRLVRLTNVLLEENYFIKKGVTVITTLCVSSKTLVAGGLTRNLRMCILYIIKT